MIEFATRQRHHRHRELLQLPVVYIWVCAEGAPEVSVEIIVFE